jgi:hypothetical protein
MPKNFVCILIALSVFAPIVIVHYAGGGPIAVGITAVTVSCAAVIALCVDRRHKRSGGEAK